MYLLVNLKVYAITLSLLVKADISVVFKDYDQAQKLTQKAEFCFILKTEITCTVLLF